MLSILFLLLVFLALFSTLYFTHKDFKKHFSNFDKLAELLNTKRKSSFFFYIIDIEGWYKDRWVECKGFFNHRPANFGTWITDDDYWRNKAPFQLSIQQAPGVKNKYPSVWNPDPRLNKPLTEYTHTSKVGRVFYTYLKVSDSGRKFRIFAPKLSTEQDKKTLWAFYSMELSKNEIQFFLDELVNAANLVT